MIELFKEKGLKLTKQRKLIFEIIDENEETTFEEIKERCKNEMDNSTIYRIIELFLERDLVIKNVDNNKVYYSINKHEHNHYIYCVKCHKKTNIEICPIEEIESKGYKLLSHQIKINGICSECQKK